jgi:hypothetical protein
MVHKSSAISLSAASHLLISVSWMCSRTVLRLSHVIFLSICSILDRIYSAVVVNSCLVSLPSTVLLMCPLRHSIGRICPVVDCHNVLLDILQPIGILHQLLVLSGSYTPQWGGGNCHCLLLAVNGVSSFWGQVRCSESDNELMDFKGIVLLQEVEKYQYSEYST